MRGSPPTPTLSRQAKRYLRTRGKGNNRRKGTDVPRSKLTPCRAARSADQTVFAL